MGTVPITGLYIPSSTVPTTLRMSVIYRLHPSTLPFSNTNERDLVESRIENVTITRQSPDNGTLRLYYVSGDEGHFVSSDFNVSYSGTNLGPCTFNSLSAALYGTVTPFSGGSELRITHLVSTRATNGPVCSVGGPRYPSSYLGFVAYPGDPTPTVTLTVGYRTRVVPGIIPQPDGTISTTLNFIEWDPFDRVNSSTVPRSSSEVRSPYLNIT